MKIWVYLAGPIHGRTDAQAMDWRQWVTSRLDSKRFEVFDPMRRDYRGKEAGNDDEIVFADLNDISRVDAVIVNAETPSWGTAMEMVYASLWNKTIIAVGPNTSPWVIKHSTHRVSTMKEAVELIQNLRWRRVA